MTDPASPDPVSTDQLIHELYDRLRRGAEARMGGERLGHTLSPTALVNEAWLRLSGRESWNSRAEFYFAAAEAMRRVLVESARRRSSIKRGGGLVRVTLGAEDAWHEFDPTDFLALEEALTQFENVHPRAGKVVRLRILAGLDSIAIADLLDISRQTVDRDLCFARAWLGKALLFENPEVE